MPRFNTQPPEGGWPPNRAPPAQSAVSTHSRPKAAGQHAGQHPFGLAVSTHSRPKAAGRPDCVSARTLWFQHTAARRRLGPKPSKRKPSRRFQHTAARRRLVDITFRESGAPQFQHTAARRRLEIRLRDNIKNVPVSTHSRPKAAGRDGDVAHQAV